MQRVIDAHGSRMLDRYIIKNKYSSINKLIDLVGSEIYRFMLSKFKNIKNKKILVVAGKGNNGSDAISSHSIFIKNRLKSDLFITDSINQKETLLRYSVQSYFKDFNKLNLLEYDIIIDGIFGIGINREILSDDLLSIIKNINKEKNRCTIISIDIPSGTCATSGYNFNSIIADITLAITYPKLGSFIKDGITNTGELISLNIKFPNYKKIIDYPILLNQNDIKKICLSDTNYKKWLSNRKTANKYTNGVTVLASNSKDINEYPGANILSQDAIISTGVGVSYHFVHDLSTNLFDISLSIPESIFINRVGNKLLNKINSVLIRDKDSFLLDTNIPKVCDGAAISAISNHKSIRNTVFTPHIGEFLKYFDINKQDYESEPLSVYKHIIKTKINDNIIIVKGPNTFILSSKGIYIIDFGKSILASAGTGDILSGIITSLLSKQLSLLNASLIGVAIHSVASILYYEKISNASFRSRSLLNFIPEAFSILFKKKQNIH